MMEKLKVINLAKSYDRDVPVLRDISFCVDDRDFFVILGPSGLCAKSTEFQDIRIRNDSWMIMRISTIQITTRIGIIWIIMQINAIRTMMRIGVAEIATMMTTMTIDGTV